MKIKKSIEFISFNLLVIVFFLSLQSCTKHMVFDKYTSLQNEEWHKDSIIKFDFNPVDSLSKNNIYVNIRNNKEYEFSNLFLIVGINFPNNYKIVDTLEYEMTDVNGRFLGTGMTDILENVLEYKTNVAFPIKGTYEIQIQHAMRKSQNVDGIVNLKGISDVGVEIEKVN